MIDNSTEYERILLEMIQSIPMLVPYAKNKKTTNYIITDKDGLLEFSSELPFLKEDYNKIFTDNYTFLESIKLIRNKLEHKMHLITLFSIEYSTCSLFSITYTIGQRKITFTANDFIKFIMQINALFSKIQRLVEGYVFENELGGNPYFRRLIRYDFCNFNKIYTSDLLRNVGQAFFSF